MTVGELIQELNNYPDNMPVWVYGNNYISPILSVDLFDNKRVDLNTVIL